MTRDFQPANGKVALVTGAGGGIGLSCAEQLAVAGFAVVMVGRSRNVLEAAEAIGNQAVAEVVPFLCDVAQEDQMQSVVQQVDDRFGRCDVLVNNAGIHPKNEGGKFMLEDMSTAQWNEVLSVNLTSAFVFARAALPMMKRHRWGRIINIASRGGRTASPVASAHYAASKAGMIGFNRTLALEGAPFGVTANVVAPGPVLTAMTDKSTPEVRAAFAKSVPLGRYGDPEEIASVVCFIAGEGSSFMTGAVIDVNGGSFMP